MLSRIALENFKCFQSQPFEIGRLNVLSGANGAGKSTVIQALLLLLQSQGRDKLTDPEIQLNGNLVSLGTPNDVLFRRSDSDQFTIEVTALGGRVVTATVHPNREVPTAHAASMSGDITLLDELRTNLYYLSADRFGPRLTYPVWRDRVPLNQIGRHGEFAPLVLAQSRGLKIENQELLLENTHAEVFDDLETQFGLWMSKLFPGFSSRADLLDHIDSVALGLNLSKEVGEVTPLRPPNVAFGVSVALPIVLAGVRAKRGDLLIVENPETHLHPFAQSLIGEFLARVAAGGAQVIVETHSDHVINGIRLAYKNGFNTDDNGLRLFAFSRTDDYGSHRVASVLLGRNGEYLSQPDGFFDQMDKDLRSLYGI